MARPSKYGNPFKIGIDGSREEVVAKYREWLLEQPNLVKAAKIELKGRVLGCFCSPSLCHADILAEIANED